MAVTSFLRGIVCLVPWDRDTDSPKAGFDRATGCRYLPANLGAIALTPVPEGFRKLSFGSLLSVCSSLSLPLIILNPDDVCFRVDVKRIEDADMLFRSVQTAVQSVFRRGFTGEDMFPALALYVMSLYVSCLLQDGTELQGLVIFDINEDEITEHSLTISLCIGWSFEDDWGPEEIIVPFKDIKLLRRLDPVSAYETEAGMLS